MTYTPDRRSIYLQGCASMDNPPHERGLIPPWLDRDRAEQWMRNCLWNPHSDRILLHFPFGRGPTTEDGVQHKNTSAQWWSAEPWRRDLMSNLMQEAIADGKTIEAYGASRQWHPDTMEPGPWRDLDYNDILSVACFGQTWRPWIELGLSRIWLDNSCHPTKINGVIRFADFMSQYPLGMEAPPVHWNRTGGFRCIDPGVWRQMPCIIWVTLNDNWNVTQAVVPDDCEGVIVTLKERQTAEDVAAWRANGWTVASGSRATDDLVFG